MWNVSWPAGPDLDQLAELVAVARLRLEQREDQQLGGAFLELAIERARVDSVIDRYYDDRYRRSNGWAWRSVRTKAYYSWRKAVIGLNGQARHAGTNVAINATAITNTTDAASVGGSSGLTSKSND